MDRLRLIRSDCEAQYTKGEYLAGSDIGTQEIWMQMDGLAPQVSDVKNPNDLAPLLYPNVD